MFILLVSCSAGSTPPPPPPLEDDMHTSTGGGIKKKKKKKTEYNFASGIVELRPQFSPARVLDLQQLLLYILLPHSNGPCPRWCSVRPRTLPHRVVLLFAHGIDSSMHLPPVWKDTLGEPITFRARHPNTLPVQTVHSVLSVLPPRKRVHATPGNGDGMGGGEPSSQGGTASTVSPPPAKRIRLDSDKDVATASNIGDSNNADDKSAPPPPTTTNDVVTFPPSTTTTTIPIPPLLPPPQDYILTLDQLTQYKYPLPVMDADTEEMVCPPGYVSTKLKPVHTSSSSSTTIVPQPPDMVAIDCEMCITEEGFELTRVLMLDRNASILLDELVLPHNPITNYNTEYSGIIADMLENVTTRLEDVQQQVLDLISADTIIIAHGGENDLRALKIIHTKVVDTVALYPHHKGGVYRSALRVLARRFLNRPIQMKKHNDRVGHDPFEDAKAALDLALLKFSRGPSFGVPTGDKGRPMTQVLTNHGRMRSTLVDRLYALRSHVAGDCNSVVVEDDAAAVAGLVKEVARPGVGFVCGEFLELAEYYDYLSLMMKRTEEEEEEKGKGKETKRDLMIERLLSGKEGEEEAVLVERMGQRVKAVVDACPLGTLLFIVTGQGNTVCHKALEEERYMRTTGGEKERWSAEMEVRFNAYKERVLDGLCFVKFIG